MHSATRLTQTCVQMQVADKRRPADHDPALGHRLALVEMKSKAPEIEFRNPSGNARWITPGSLAARA